MKLTKPQQQRFWREWSAVTKHQKAHGPGPAWNTEQAEAARHDLLQRCGFSSLTHVDRTSGFDRLLAELGVLRDNLTRTIESLPAETLHLPAGDGTATYKDNEGQRRRFKYVIRKHAQAMGGEPYAIAIARDRFHLVAGLKTIEDLTTEQLHQLMITLAARHHKKDQSNQSYTSEEQFPDEIEFLPTDGTEPETVGTLSTASHSNNNNPF